MVNTGEEEWVEGEKDIRGMNDKGKNTLKIKFKSKEKKKRKKGGNPVICHPWTNLVDIMSHKISQLQKTQGIHLYKIS